MFIIYISFKISIPSIFFFMISLLIPENLRKKYLRLITKITIAYDDEQDISINEYKIKNEPNKRERRDQIAQNIKFSHIQHQSHKNKKTYAYF